jgi:hypothetical protein
LESIEPLLQLNLFENAPAQRFPLKATPVLALRYQPLNPFHVTLTQEGSSFSRLRRNKWDPQKNTPYDSILKYLSVLFQFAIGSFLFKPGKPPNIQLPWSYAPLGST